MDLKATGARIAYDLIAASLYSKDLGLLLNSGKGKEREEEVDLHVCIFAVLSNYIRACVEK